MTTAILIIAHTPLAHALRDCVLHVYPEAYNDVLAVDVLPHESPEVTIETVRRVLDNTPHSATLILTDMFGATPCNVAQKMLDGIHTRLVAGANLPMLLRAVNYRHEPLDVLATRAMNGGMQCIMQVAVTAPLNQNRTHHNYHDQKHHHHQQ